MDRFHAYSNLDRKEMENCAKLNILEPSKLTVLLMRFNFVSCSQEYLFTVEEKEKMQTSLNLSTTEFNDILEIIRNILFESVQNTIHPKDLKEKLISYGMQEGHAQIFSDLWLISGKTIVGKLKKLSLAEWQMRGLSWEFHAEASSTNTARQKCPIAVMNLQLCEPSYPLEIKATNENTSINSKNIIFQMDKQDLLEFYNELEKIQLQIDSLKS